MQKWVAFFLSDHTVQINKDNQKANTTYKKRDRNGPRRNK